MQPATQLSELENAQRCVALLTRLLHSGVIREKGEQNGVALHEKADEAFSIGSLPA
jgi:hypothetical protein